MLTLQDLSKTYADGTRALERVTLDLRAGEIVALVGGSGCGKTTLVRLVAGLDRASAGAISLDGTPIDGRPRAEVSIVFQEPRLLPWLRVAANIGFGITGLPAPERAARVEAALQAIGLSGYGGRWPRELSGGQAQRVSIARALVTKPKVLLLDEPFSALDAMTRASLHEHLLALWSATRPTLLMVTHDVEEAVSLADRIVVMQPRPGRVFDEIALPLARPRDRRSPAFEAARLKVLESLEASLRPDAKPAAERASESAGLWW
jgi:sulfonate transport system ATP-binding protein